MKKSKKMIEKEYQSLQSNIFAAISALKVYEYENKLDNSNGSSVQLRGHKITVNWEIKKLRKSNI